MTNRPSIFPTGLFAILLVALLGGGASGDLVELDAGNILASEEPGNGLTAQGPFLAGTSTFNVTAAQIPEVELLANFSIVDAGVRIEVNNTRLFPDFDDVSEFGNQPVFTNTGEPAGGGINNPFTPNNFELPRLTVNSTSAGTTFSGATFVDDTATRLYTPVFTVEDFNSLLREGSNTIDFFVLNSFEGANLQGDYTVARNVASVPEPGMTGVALLALFMTLSRRRRR